MLVLGKETNVQKERQGKAIINDIRAVTRAAYTVAATRRLLSKDVIVTFTDIAARKGCDVTKVTSVFSKGAKIKLRSLNLIIP